MSFGLILPIALSAAVPSLSVPPIEIHAPPPVSQSLEQRLASRLADLKAAETEDDALLISADVRSIWRQQAGPTADLLLSRARLAIEVEDFATAERSFFHLRQLEPDYAEGWVASAAHAMTQSDWSFALEALSTAVTLDANRFDAWTMLGQALERADAREAALEAYGEALALYPFSPAARRGYQRLEDELAGRAL